MQRFTVYSVTRPRWVHGAFRHEAEGGSLCSGFTVNSVTRKKGDHGAEGGGREEEEGRSTQKQKLHQRGEETKHIVTGEVYPKSI